MRFPLALLLAAAGCYDFDVSHRVDGGTAAGGDMAAAPGSFTTVPSTTSSDLIAMWGSGGQLFVVEKGTGKLLHSSDNGATFGELVLTPAIVATAIWGSSLSDLWVASPDGANFSTNGGQTWSTTLLSVSAVAGLFGVTAGRPILLTPNGLFTFDGSSWANRPLPTTQRLAALGGTSAADLWAVGASGAIVTSSNGGMSWTVVSSESSANLRGIVSRPSTGGSNNPGGVTVIGEGGTILDGIVFPGSGGGSFVDIHPAGVTQALNSIFAVSPSDVYIVGDGGVILHSKTGGFEQLPSPTQNNLLAVFGTGAGNVIAVGAKGTILRLTLSPTGAP